MKTLSERLKDYLPLCPENFRLVLTEKLKTGTKLSRATEAARRMATKDAQGAWKILSTI